MTFKVSIIYTASGTKMVKECSGIEKVKTAFDKHNDEYVEYVRFYETPFIWFSIKADAILNINMTPED